jgi:MFS family permease
MSGVFMTTYQTQDQALLQLSAPRHIRGRVMSFYLISRATVPIGTLFAGVLASYFSGPAAVQMMSLSALGLVVLVISTHPGFLRLKVNLEERVDAPVVVD